METKRTFEAVQNDSQQANLEGFPSIVPAENAGMSSATVINIQHVMDDESAEIRLLQQLMAMRLAKANSVSPVAHDNSSDSSMQLLLKAVSLLTEKVEQMTQKLELLGQKVEALEVACAPTPPAFPYHIAPDRKTDFIKLTKALTIDKMFVNEKGLPPKNKEMIKAASQLMNDPSLVETYTSVLSRAVNGNEKAFLQVFKNLCQEMKEYKAKTNR